MVFFIKKHINALFLYKKYINKKFEYIFCKILFLIKDKSKKLMKPKTTNDKKKLFKMNKSLGQNILRSKNVVTGIVDAAEAPPGSVVLEIGPGNGNMTEEMLSRNYYIIAIEKDPRMCVELQRRPLKNKENLRLIQADVLQSDLPDFDYCISNIPYNISSAIVFRLLAKPFRRSVLLVQKEFGERMCAKPGKDGWSRLSVNVQLYATCKIAMHVSRKNFVPPPKVDSVVVSIQQREERPNIDFEEWDGMIQLLFNRPNKTCRALLTKKKTIATMDENRKRYYALFKKEPTDDISDVIEKILSDTLLHDSRPSNMTIDDFVNLFLQFNKHNIHFK